MSNMTTKLKFMGMEAISDYFLVNYNTLKEKWNFQEIKVMLMQEEGRLKQMKDNFIHLMTHDGANTSKSKEEFVKRRSATSTSKVVTLRRTAQKRRNGLKRKNRKISLHGEQNKDKDRGHWDIQINYGYWMSCRFGMMPLCTSCDRNLVSVSKLDDLGFNFKIEDNFIKSLFNVECVVGSKRNVHDDNFAYLWHQRLGNISKERSQLADVLEVFIDEVERQLDREVKVVRFGRGGEFYGKFNESGQCLGPFAKFLENRGICAQYTMPSTSQ
ncbi:hypothetical protein CR513_43861, partial [Mucuna pruriens]